MNTSLYLRPIFASRDIVTDVVAVTESQLLLRLNLLEFVVARIEQTGDNGLVFSAPLPEESVVLHLADLKSFSFADNRTICFVEHPEVGRGYVFVALRADDELFQNAR